MCCTIFQKEKTPFVDDKSKTFNKSKIGIFSKGVRVHDFGQKLSISPLFYRRLNRRGKCVSRYFRAFLGYKNKKFKKSKNGSFSKGVSPWFWSKSISFSILLFQAKNARKKCFTIFYKEKKSFYALKSSPIDELINPQRFTHKSTDRNDRQRARLYVVCPCEV